MRPRAFILRDAAQGAAPQDEDRPRQASPPLLFEARGRLHSSPPSRGRHFPHPKTRGMARRWAQPSFQCAIPFGIAAPAGAPSRRSPSGAGPRFLPGIPARTVSQLLAGGRSASGRSPGAARVRGCEPRPRAPRPVPLSRRLMTAPLDERDPLRIRPPQRAGITFYLRGNSTRRGCRERVAAHHGRGSTRPSRLGGHGASPSGIPATSLRPGRPKPVPVARA